MLVHPGFLCLCNQFFQLRERIGQFPAMFPQQGLVVGDAVARFLHTPQELRRSQSVRMGFALIFL